MASEFDDMAFDEGDDMMSDEPAEETGLEDMGEEVDAEFAMHASAAGFDTPEKQKALKMAIERCYAMKEESEGEEEVADMNAEDDELEGLGALADMG